MKRTKAILSASLTVVALLTVIAGMNVDIPTANPKWGPLQAGGLTFPLLRVGSTSVYDPFSNRMILFAGKSADDATGNPSQNDVWILTKANGLENTTESRKLIPAEGPPANNAAATPTATPTWSRLMPTGGPPSVRYDHSAVYDAVNNRMIIYGGCGGGCLPIADDVWVLDHANGLGGTPTWTQLSPPQPHPPFRQGHQAVYDPNTNSMIIWAGQNGGGERCAPDARSDVWVLSHANGLGGAPNWTRLLPTGGPPAGRYFSTAVYDSSNNLLIVFGGIGMVGANCQSTNAVWALSNANGTGGTPVWRNLIAQDADGSPENRDHQAAVYQPGANAMTIFGGDSTTGAFFGDTWVLHNANGMGPADPVWNLLTDATGPVPSSRWNGGVIDTGNHRMIMFGGSGDGLSGISAPLWTTWILRPSIGPPGK